MHFETALLPPSLQPYLESIFHYKDFIPDHSIERVVPTGHVFVIFELDGMVRNTFDNETLQPKSTFTKAWLSGMHKHYISISAHQQSEMFVMQFKAMGAHPFFHVPIEKLTDQVIPAENILGEDILQLREELLVLGSSEEKFIRAFQWLEDRFDEAKIPPKELVDVVEQLQKKSGIDYSTIVEQYPNTQKHLIDQFKKYVGLTPKYYQRILRFNDILLHIKQKTQLPWAQVAYHSGCSDQSHFIKEFKHFSGFNPKEFIQQGFHQDEPNFFALNREG